MNQNYLIIENNVVTNIIFWNGNTQTWTPPADSIQLIQSTIPAINWQAVEDAEGHIIDWALVEQMGLSSIGFTWDGKVCTTNEPKPPIPNEIITT